MTSPTTDQHRSPLPVLSLLLAAAAAIIGLVAIATDDVSSRPSQIVVTPLDDSHPAAAPDNARPANQEVDDANDHPHYNPPENARPSHVLVPELDDSHPAAVAAQALPGSTTAGPESSGPGPAPRRGLLLPVRRAMHTWQPSPKRTDGQVGPSIGSSPYSPSHPAKENSRSTSRPPTPPLSGSPAASSSA